MTGCPEFTQSFWQWHPPVGVFIAILAVLGVAVPWFRGEIKPREKAFWTAIMFLLVILEIRSIYLDQEQHDREQDLARCQQLESFREIAHGIDTAIKNSQLQFQTTLTTDQQHFEATIQKLSDSGAEDRKRFEALINKSNELFDHEERLAESTSGTLRPGNFPMPTEKCLVKKSGDMLLMIGDNAFITDRFPHVVVSDGEPVITLDRNEDNSVAVIMDVRGKDNKIIARLDKSGYVIGSRLLIHRPNGSTLVVVDEYGQEVLNIKYLNAQAISINGALWLNGKSFPLQLRNMHGGCTSYGGGEADVMLRTIP